MKRAALILFALIAACGGGNESTTTPIITQPVDTTKTIVSVASVTLTAPTQQLLPLGTAQLTAVVKDATGATLTDRTVSWSSSSQGVLTVSSSGLVTAGASGSATITAVSEGRSATANIAVGEVNSLTAAGGTVIAASGKVQLAFPAGAVTSNTQIAVTPIVNPVTTSLTIPGTAYEFGPSGSFAAPVDASIKYDVAQLPASVDQSKLLLYTLVDGAWQASNNSYVDTVAHVVHAPITHFSGWTVCTFPCYADAARVYLSGTGKVVLPIKQGASATYPTTVYLANVSRATLSFTLNKAPTGMTASVSQAVDGVYTWTINVGSSVPVGRHVVELTAHASGATDGIYELYVDVSSAAYTVAFNPSTIPVVQGASATSAIAIVRDGVTSSVGLSVTGLPTGVTASFAPQTTTGNTSVLTLQAAAGAPTGNFNNIMVRSTAAGVTNDVLTPISIVVVSASGFSIAGAPSAVALTPGSSVSGAIKATRSNGFTGAISYAISGLPNGLSAVLTSTAVADSTKIAFTATALTLSGNYNIVVTGTANGKSETANILVTVGVPGISTVQLDFSQCLANGKTLLLFAQDGNGTWTALNGSNGLYSFQVASGRGAFAAVQPVSGGFDIFVNYGTPAELPLQRLCFAPTGTKSVNVSAAGLALGDWGDVFIGGSGATLSSALPTATLPSVAEGPLDLIGWRYHGSTPDASMRGIIRRDQTIPNNGTAPVLDFNSAEAFTPVGAGASISGGTPSFNYITGVGTTVNGCGYGGFLGNHLNLAGTIYGVPAALQRSTDRHVLGTTLSTATSYRSATSYFRAMTAQSLNLPTALPTPNVTTVAGPYRRLQVAFTLPSDYTVANYRYSDGKNSITLSGNAGYFSGSSMTLITPDLSGVAGYSASWFTTTLGSLTYSFTANSVARNNCDDGSTIYSAGISGTTN